MLFQHPHGTPTETSASKEPSHINEVIRSNRYIANTDDDNSNSSESRTGKRKSSRTPISTKRINSEVRGKKRASLSTTVNDYLTNPSLYDKDLTISGLSRNKYSDIFHQIIRIKELKHYYQGKFLYYGELFF